MSALVRKPETLDEQVQTFPRIADSGVSVRAPEVTFPYYITPHLLAQRVLGEGGTAIVLEAIHTRLKVRVAVKILKLSGPGASEARERMQREAELCARIDNPRIPRIYDVDTLADGTPYVVMEEVHGSPLDELLDKGPLDVDLACAITCEVLEALGELHSAGIVHRDVKPSNLILEDSANGSLRVRVLDLGIAKPIVDDSPLSGSARLTMNGTLLGTPHYMANEQLLGGEVDERTDIYAVGVMLYEILAGKTPFNGDTVSQVIASALRDIPVPLRDLRQDIPRRLQEIVTRAMQRDATLRYASARAMLDDLHAFQASETAWPRDAPTLLAPPAPRASSVAPTVVAASVEPTPIEPAPIELAPIELAPIEPVPSSREAAEWAARALHSLPPAAEPPSRWRRVRIWSGVTLAAGGAVVALSWPSELGDSAMRAVQRSDHAPSAVLPTERAALTEPPRAGADLPMDVTDPVVSPAVSPMQIKPDQAPSLLLPLAPSPLLPLTVGTEDPVDSVEEPALGPTSDEVGPLELAGEPPAAAPLEPDREARTPSDEPSSRTKLRAKRKASAQSSASAPERAWVEPSRTTMEPPPALAEEPKAPTTSPVEPPLTRSEPPPGLPLNPYLERFEDTTGTATEEADASSSGLPSNPYPANE